MTISTELGSWQGLAENVRDALHRFVHIVRETLGARVLSVSFFGEICSPEWESKQRPARSAVVLDEVDLAALRRLAEYGRNFGAAGIAAPLILTPDALRTSLDTYPLEFLEIQQHHVTVLGKDYFAGLVFERPHVRLQCERELKTALLALRQGLLSSAGRDNFVAAVVEDIAEGLLRTLRGLLWLSDSTSATSHRELPDHAERILNRSLGGLRDALDPQTDHDWSTFQQLYADVSALRKYVDAL